MPTIVEQLSSIPEHYTDLKPILGEILRRIDAVDRRNSAALKEQDERIAKEKRVPKRGRKEVGG